MRQNVNKASGRADGSGGRLVRASVVLASLVSLCVSDGIGPRLVPYPSQLATERAASATRESRLSAVRSETCAASEHQPKAVTPVWNNAALGRAAISPPSVRPTAQPDLYASPGYSFRDSSSTRGRAPPRNS